MRATVLGSGQDGGLPQAGATHQNDLAARDGLILERTASSVLVEHAGRRILLDASPDFRIQWWPFASMPDTVVLTHGHMGHYTGLVHFGSEAGDPRGIECVGTPAMLQFLRSNAPWRQLFEVGNLVSTGSSEIQLIPIPHRAEYTDTVAISVDSRLLYLPDIDSWDLWPEAPSVLAAHQVALVDATFWSPTELPARTGIPHPPVEDTIERFADLDTRLILTHLNHTNPICDPTSREAGLVVEAGFEVAYDGMVIDL
ncbi:MAG: MBL fold metallo-hydrolase [Acidimicrobiia bacterium]|nr:MBL fold metallo-hydrolase [Acidimicrobiia bacterium]